MSQFLLVKKPRRYAIFIFYFFIFWQKKKLKSYQKSWKNMKKCNQITFLKAMDAEAETYVCLFFLGLKCFFFTK